MRHDWYFLTGFLLSLIFLKILRILLLLSFFPFIIFYPFIILASCKILFFPLYFIIKYWNLSFSNFNEFLENHIRMYILTLPVNFGKRTGNIKFNEGKTSLIIFSQCQEDHHFFPAPQLCTIDVESFSFDLGIKLHFVKCFLLKFWDWI